METVVTSWLEADSKYIGLVTDKYDPYILYSPELAPLKVCIKRSCRTPGEVGIVAKIESVISPDMGNKEG